MPRVAHSSQVCDEAAKKHGREGSRALGEEYGPGYAGTNWESDERVAAALFANFSAFGVSHPLKP